jgi:plasmid stabilization system protein ParE
VTRPVVLRRAARADVDEAFDWYESQQSGLGTTFVMRVRATLEQIAERPHLYDLVLGDVRRAVVRGLPYTIFYRVEPSRIRVLAVFHTARDPRIWQSRL